MQHSITQCMTLKGYNPIIVNIDSSLYSDSLVCKFFLHTVPEQEHSPPYIRRKFLENSPTHAHRHKLSYGDILYRLKIYNNNQTLCTRLCKHKYCDDYSNMCTICFDF